METLEEKVGYLLRAVEENKSDVKHLTMQVDELSQMVAKKFNTAETTLRIIKWFGLAIVAILTFKFGDITSLWQNLK